MPRRAASPSTPPHALRRIREARGLTRAELARRSGFSASHVVKLERGEARLHVDDLAVFAAALDCEPADLVRPDAPAPSGGTIHAPVLDVTELDDIEAVAAAAPHGTVPVPGEIRRPLALLLVDGAMDRVAPLGSIAVFDRDDRVLQDGEIYLVRHGGRWLCRRWHKRPGGDRLEPDSREGGHAPITVEAPPEVAGRLRAVVRKL
jgi:transcriptional regulator with XRE-family HTH domain